MIEFTDWARDVLANSHTAAVRFNPDARIRLARTDHGGVQALLADGADPGDQELAVGDVAVLVQEGLEGLIDVMEPHEQIVLRPLGSTPNIREHHD